MLSAAAASLHAMRRSVRLVICGPGCDRLRLPSGRSHSRGGIVAADAEVFLPLRAADHARYAKSRAPLASSLKTQVLLAEIRHEHRRDLHATIGLEIVFQQRRKHARNGQT